MQDYGVLLSILLALLVGLAAGKAWERYKLQEGRWVDRRKIRQSPHFILGLNHLVSGQVDLAIADFDRAIELDPNQAEAYLNKGAALLRRENPGEAMNLFTIALERNTTRPALAHYGRAIANETLGNLGAAYRDYTAAARIDPEWNQPRQELTRFRVVSQ